MSGKRNKEAVLRQIRFVIPFHVAENKPKTVHRINLVNADDRDDLIEPARGF
jgi:hypothetical protein